MFNAEPSIVLAILLFRASDRQAKRARPYIVDLYFERHTRLSASNSYWLAESVTAILLLIVARQEGLARHF